MSLFQISIRSVLTQIRREYDIKKLDPKYVNTAIFYFQQLDSLDVFTKEQNKKWAKSISDAFLSAKEHGFNESQIIALNSYLDIIAKKIAAALPYYQSYKKVIINFESICQIRHHLGIGTHAYEVYKDTLKLSVCPSNRDIANMVELENLVNKRTIETRELGDYVVLSRKLADLLRKTSSIFMRLRQDYHFLEQTYVLFNLDFYKHIYFIPSGQMDLLRNYHDKLLSANSLLERVEKNLADKNAQGQLFDVVAALKKLSLALKKQVSIIKENNNVFGFGDYHSDEGRVIRIDDVVGFKRKAA